MPTASPAQHDGPALPAVLAQLPDAVSVFDGAWRYRYVNQAAAALLREHGVDAGAVLGRTLWAVRPALRGTSVERALRAVARERRTLAASHRAARSFRWYEVRGVPMDDGLMLLERDVTQLRSAEERARLLAETSHALAASLDPTAALATVAELLVPAVSDWCAVDVVDEDGQIRRIATMHADAERRAWAERVQDSVAPRLDDPAGIGHVIRTGAPFFAPEIADEMLARLAPSPQHLAVWRAMRMRSAVTVPLRARERTLGALTFIQSESQRRFGTDELELATEIARRIAIAIDNVRLLRTAERARRDAEAASRAKTEFLAVMSHELRTPLNAIAGYAELMELGVRGPVTAEQQADLARIRRSQRHLLGLINDVLNFAKLETGTVRYRAADVSVRDLLREVESLVSPQLAARGLRSAWHAQPDELCARADPELLRQILLNLLSNAVRFTDAGGDVAVRAWHEGDHVLVQVRDSGSGIEPEQLERIFEPFVQLHRSLSTPGEGAGLGLAISRDLARGMGGDLLAESTPGTGSVFTLLVPVAQPTVSAAAARGAARR